MDQDTFQQIVEALHEDLPDSSEPTDKVLLRMLFRQAAVKFRAADKLSADLPVLLDALVVGNRVDQLIAAYWLKQTQIGVIPPPLIVAALSANSEQRGILLYILSRSLGVRGLSLLANALEDRDSTVRWYAVIALSASKDVSDEAALPLLERAFDDADERICYVAARALRTRGWRPSATEPTVRFLIFNGQWARCAMLGADAVATLVPFLQHDRATLRLTAGKALEKMGWRPASLAEAVVFHLGMGHEADCLDLGAAAAPLLATIAVDAGRSIELRLPAIRVLGRLSPDDAVDTLLALLQSPIARIRNEAVGALGAIGSTTCVQALVAALGDESWLVRWAARGALVKLGKMAAPALVGVVEAGQGVERALAIMALGQVGEPVAVPALTAALVAPDWAVQWAALCSLGQISDTVSADSVVGFLSDDNALLRQAAAQALGRTASDLTPLLAETTRDPDPNVRLVAIQALGDSGDNAAVTVLIHGLRDNTEQVRVAAARALGQIRSLDAEQALIRELLSVRPVGPLRAAVIRALGQIGGGEAVQALLHFSLPSAWTYYWDSHWVSYRYLDTIHRGHARDAMLPREVAAAFQADQQECVKALQQLCKANTDALAVLLSRLSTGDWELMKIPLLVLRELDEASLVPGLLVALLRGDTQARLQAENIIPQLRSPEAKQQLFAALADTQLQGRERIIALCASFNEPLAIGALVPLLRDRERTLRQATVQALNRLHWEPVDHETMIDYAIAAEQWQRVVEFGEAALLPLQVVLLDGDIEVRQGALAALVQIGHEPPELAQLYKQLRDPSRDVRHAAAERLDQLGWRPLDDESAATYAIAAERWEALLDLGAPAVPLLVAALQDTAAEVRRGAANALERLDWQPPDTESLVVFALAAENLRDCVAYGERAVPALINLLQHPDRALRCVATNLLGEIGSPTTSAALCQALVDSAWEVRRAAARALGWLGEAVALPELCSVLGDSVWSVREAVAEALGQLDAPETCAALISLLRDHDWRVRRAAVNALHRLRPPDALADLLEALHDVSPKVRYAAAMALTRQSEAAVPGLLRALEEQSPSVRCLAALALRDLQSPAAAQGLIAAIHDPELQVRLLAIETLGLIGEQAVIPELVNLILRPAMLKALDVALREIADVTLTPDLYGAVDSSSRELVLCSVQALVRLLPAAAPGLHSALQSPDPDVRRLVLRALADHPDFGTYLEVLGAAA